MFDITERQWDAFIAKVKASGATVNIVSFNAPKAHITIPFGHGGTLTVEIPKPSGNRLMVDSIKPIGCPLGSVYGAIGQLYKLFAEARQKQ